MFTPKVLFAHRVVCVNGDFRWSDRLKDYPQSTMGNKKKCPKAEAPGHRIIESQTIRQTAQSV